MIYKLFPKFQMRGLSLYGLRQSDERADTDPNIIFAGLINPKSGHSNNQTYIL